MPAGESVHAVATQRVASVTYPKISKPPTNATNFQRDSCRSHNHKPAPFRAKRRPRRGAAHPAQNTVGQAAACSRPFAILLWLGT